MKTEYNEITKLFKLNYLNGRSDYNIMTRNAVAFVSYAAKYERRWCFYWVSLYKLEKYNRHIKGFSQHEKSAVHLSAVNLLNS